MKAAYELKSSHVCEKLSKLRICSCLEGLKGVQTNNSVHIRYQRGVVGGSADLALKSSRIVDFGDKSSGFADLKNTVDRGSAESFGPVSGFCQSRSSDCGLDH